jgi:hypothetical protein
MLFVECHYPECHYAESRGAQLKSLFSTEDVFKTLAVVGVIGAISAISAVVGRLLKYGVPGNELTEI